MNADQNASRVRLFTHHVSQTEEQSLEAMVAAALPADHPMASHVANSLEVVKRNPFWPAAAKQKFVRGMLRDIERG